MAYDIPLKTDPSPLPLKPAILILLHRRKKAMFIAYTTNARGRAAVLATMIRHRDKKGSRNHLRDLPDGDIKEFTVVATKVDLDKREADDAVVRLQRHYEKKGFRMFGGPRSALPKVLLNGRRMTIVDAMVEAKTKDAYQTVYRRIQRGWPVKQALGMEERA